MATDYKADVVAFMRDLVPVAGAYGPRQQIPPFLERWLYACFPTDQGGNPVERNVLDSRSKKEGKSTTAAGVALYMATREPYAEVVICAADRDQAADRVLQAAKFAVTHGPLAAHSRAYRDVIEFENGSTVKAFPMDWQGAAGGNPSCVVFDELHAYCYENMRRLWDEMIIPPTVAHGVRWVSTYAGYLGESMLLWDVWQQAIAGRAVDDELPIFHNEDAGLLALIDQGEASWRMPWLQGEAGRKYIEQQRRAERPNTFRRLWFNEWVAAESQFVPMEDWDRCEDPEVHPARATDGEPITFAADASIKNDCTALVGCIYDADRDRVDLAYVRIWNPKLLGRLDPDKTIGDELRRLHEDGYNIGACVYDPYQLETVAQSLKADGLNMIEFPQTMQRVEADQSLYTAITSRTLATFPHSELRAHVQNAVAVETPRGFRLAKDKTTAKIDGCVALSMAHWGARELYGPGRGGMQVAPNPFYSDALPEWRGPGFDRYGWWCEPHRPGVTFENCPHRMRGCYACQDEWDRVLARQ